MGETFLPKSLTGGEMWQMWGSWGQAQVEGGEHKRELLKAIGKMQVSTLALWTWRPSRSASKLVETQICCAGFSTAQKIVPHPAFLLFLFCRFSFLGSTAACIMFYTLWCTIYTEASTSSFACCVFHHILCTSSRFISADSTWPSCSEARPQKCNNLFITIFEWGGQYSIRIVVTRKGVKTILHHLTHF